MSRKIFWGRFRKSIHYQFRIVGTVLDWTVILYILIPGLIFLGIQYVSWWQDIPVWLNSIPLLFLFFIFCFFSMTGTIKTFVEQADSIFLIKKSFVFIRMKQYGYFLTILTGWLKISLMLIIVLPFFVKHYHMSGLSILTMTVYLFGQYVLFLLLNYYRKVIEERWKLWLVNILMYSIFGLIHLTIFRMVEIGMYMGIILLSTLSFAVGLFFSIKSLGSLKFMEYDLKTSKEQSAKSTNFILTLSSDVEKPIIIKRNKPLFFGKSKRIFKQRSKRNGFCELFIKVFIRNFAYWGNFLRIISVFLVAILLIPPLWIKISLLLAFLIMIHSWLTAVWNKVITFHPVTRKYIESEGYFHAKNRMVWGGSIGAFILLLSVVFLVLWL